MFIDRTIGFLTSGFFWRRKFIRKQDKDNSCKITVEQILGRFYLAFDCLCFTRKRLLWYTLVITWRNDDTVESNSLFQSTKIYICFMGERKKVMFASWVKEKRLCLLHGWKKKRLFLRHGWNKKVIFAPWVKEKGYFCSMGGSKKVIIASWVKKKVHHSLSLTFKSHMHTAVV